MPEIVTVKRIEEEPKYGAIDRVKLQSPQRLLEIAETLNVQVVYKDKKVYQFVHQNITFWAKGK